MDRRSKNKAVLRIIEPDNARKTKAGPSNKDPRCFIPDDLKKIKTKIRRYERLLAKERAECGRYTDGYGKRLLLGPLYLFQGDVGAALKHFDWFQAEFPDDGEPGQLMCWALVLIRAGMTEAAIRKLGQTMQANIHLIPHLLGEKRVRSHQPGLCCEKCPAYVGMLPPEYFEIWKGEEKAWASGVWHGGPFTAIREKWSNLDQKLDGARPGQERDKLCRERSKLAAMFDDRAGWRTTL